MYFCIQDKMALRAIIDSIRIPSLETRVCCSCISVVRNLRRPQQEVVIDMLFDLMNIKPPEWHQAFIDGRRLTSRYSLRVQVSALNLCVVYRRTKPAAEFGQTLEPAQRLQPNLKLTDQYIALLVLVLCKAGVCDVRDLSRILKCHVSHGNARP